MKIKFFWNKDLNGPWCVFYKETTQIRSNLLGFLGNYEGLGLQHLKKWINNGLNEIEKNKIWRNIKF